MRMSAWPWRSLTRQKAHTGFPRSFWRREWRGSAPGKRRTSWVCGQATLPKWCSAIVTFRQEACWARKARALSTACKSSTAGAFRSRRWVWGWRRELTRQRQNTPSSANNSGKRSASSRPSSSSWRTWRRRLRRRGCGSTKRHGSPTARERVSPRNRVWPSCTPARWRCAWPMKRCRFSGAMG